MRFERASLTEDWGGDYDLAWVYNTLSHIEPLDAFLAAAHRHLRPGGVLVIGDINGSLRKHRVRLAQLRTDVRSEYVAPDGARHQYAVERMFPPAELRQLMEENRFRVLHHELYWGGLGVLPEPIYAGLVTPIQKQWRLGTSIARRQLMVAGPR